MLSKTPQEKAALKAAKKANKKALSNSFAYNRVRESTVKRILSSRTPRWGSFSLKLAG